MRSPICLHSASYWSPNPSPSRNCSILSSIPEDGRGKWRYAPGGLSMLTLFRDDRGASQADQAGVAKPPGATGATSEQYDLARSDVAASAGLVGAAPAAQSAINGSARR